MATTELDACAARAAGAPGRQRLAAGLLVGLLYGCTQQADDVITVVVVDPPPQPSTALAENRVENGFDFGQYSRHALVLDLPALGESLSGDYYVAKLRDDELQVYYLGRLRQLEVLELSISVPRHIDRLFIELYTNDPDSEAVIEEIRL